MITRLSHATLYVLDQDSAYDFYINKLGFEVRTDHKMDNGFRWLTVGPKTQPELQMILMPVTYNPMLPDDQKQKLTDLLGAGMFSGGVLETADVQRTYEELKERGVVFDQAPEERFYGIEALFHDDSGNWFSLCQRKS